MELKWKGGGKTEPGTSVGKKSEFNMIGWEGAEEISKGKVCSMP